MTFVFRSLCNRFISGDHRTANVIKNSLASAVLKVATLACSLAIVPITINYLNPENYGIWMAMTSILYWFVFFDVGLGNGMRNYLSEAFSLGDYERARSLFSTAMLILTVIAAAIVAVAIPLVYLCDLNTLLGTNIVDRTSLANVLAIAVVFSLLQFVVKNIGMVYIAMQRYFVNDLILLIGNVLNVIIILVMTKTIEANLAYVVSVFTGIPVLVFIFAFFPLLRQFPQLKPSIKSVDLSIAKRIVSKGLGFFVIQITSCLVIFGSANVIISHYCGPEQVTVYNVSYKLFNVLIIGYTVLISPLWNAYTDAATKGDYGWIRRIFIKSLKLWGLSVIGGFVALAMSGWLFKVWIGDSVQIPFVVSASILGYVCMFNMNNCVTYLINGLNKIRVQIITSVIVTVIYLIVVFFIRGDYGIIGISLSMMLAYLIMAAVHLYQCYLLANNKAKGIWNK